MPSDQRLEYLDDQPTLPPETKESKVEKKVEKGIGYILVTKGEQGANEKMIYDLLKEQTAYKDAQVNVSKDGKSYQVKTREGRMYEFANINTTQKVLSAMQTLHDQGVLHGDLKPEHIRQDQHLNSPFFIDFGCAVLGNLQPAKGLTRQWASLDGLIRNTVHELDDYEAVLMTAFQRVLDKVEIGFDLPMYPENPKSSKQWAIWKLKFMEVVFDYYFKELLPKAQGNLPQSESPEQTLSWVVQKLLAVWTIPRKRDRLTPKEKTLLTSNEGFFRLDKHALDVRGKFACHLGRYTRIPGLTSGQDKLQRNRDDLTKPRPLNTYTSTALGEEPQQLEAAKDYKAVSCMGENVRECPSVVLWATPRDSAKKHEPKTKGDPKKKVPQSETKNEIKDDVAWAEYDTLFIHDNDILDRVEHPSNKGKRWKYDDGWNFGNVFGAKLIDRIGGKYLLFLETASNDKHIAHFLTTFECFVLLYSLRPLDVLLLIIGLQIECHKQAFYPQHFQMMVDTVQHSNISCANHANCKKSLPNDNLFYCPCGLMYCSVCSAKHREEKGEKPNEKGMHQSKMVHKDLLPNLSLFVLLLAGRVRITNNIAATTLDLTSTAKNEELRSAVEVLKQEMAQLKAERAADKAKQAAERASAAQIAQLAAQMAQLTAAAAESRAAAETAEALTSTAMKEERQNLKTTVEELRQEMAQLRAERAAERAVEAAQIAHLTAQLTAAAETAEAAAAEVVPAETHPSSRRGKPAKRRNNNVP